jgi:hypothetical protein
MRDTVITNFKFDTVGTEHCQLYCHVHCDSEIHCDQCDLKTVTTFSKMRVTELYLSARCKVYVQLPMYAL